MEERKLMRPYRKWLLLYLVLLLCSAPCLAQGTPGSDAEAAVRAELDPAVAARVEETARQDQFIEDLLAARFSRVESLGTVEVGVTAGVVTLQGVVEEETLRELAEQLTENVEGVVAVNNRLQLETAVNRRLAPVLVDGLERLKRLIVTLPLVVVAGLLVFAAYLVGHLVTRWQRPFRRLRNPFLADLLRHAIRLLFLAGGLLLALNLLGATSLVSAVLGAAGIAGLALGFAFRDLVENYMAGILLSLRQPFAPDDHVVIDGHEGRVATLTSRATSLITLDGNHLRLPNALVFKGVILNYTRNPTRLFAFDVTLISGAQVARAQEAARRALEITPGVLREPAPGVLLKDLSPGGVVLSCSGWVDQRSTNFYKVQSTAMRRVEGALEAEGVLPDRVSRVAVVAQQDGAEGDMGEVSGRLDSDAEVAVEEPVEEQLQSERQLLAKHNLLRRDAPRE